MRDLSFPGLRPRRPSAAKRRRNLTMETLENRVALSQLQYGLFDTGVDGRGNVLPGGSSDPHYTLVVTQQGSAGMNAVVVSSQPGGWVPNSLTDSWIAPIANENSGSTSPPGNYEYQTTFTLPAGSGTNGQFTGSLTADNDLTDFLVNGVSTGYSLSNFSGYVTFRVDGGLVPGTNTLDFMVNNGGTSFQPDRVPRQGPGPELPAHGSGRQPDGGRGVRRVGNRDRDVRRDEPRRHRDPHQQPRDRHPGWDQQRHLHLQRVERRHRRAGDHHRHQ